MKTKLLSDTNVATGQALVTFPRNTNSGSYSLVFSILILCFQHFKSRMRLIPEPTIWKYFVQICSALECMHSKRIMHRGKSHIKPKYEK